MVRKSLSLLPLAAALLLGASVRSNAQTLQWVSQSGTITLDKVNYMSISVSTSQWLPGDGTAPQVAGAINMSGSNGVISVNLGAHVKAMNAGFVTVNNKPVKQANLTSSAFYYVDLNSGKKTLAYMQATVLQSGKGGFRFQIIDATTFVTLAASASSDGQFNTYSLSSGSTTIIF